MKRKNGNITTSNNRREELLTLCYTRLRELIPECDSEVNLLKCIEILERHASNGNNEEARFSAIADTLDRLAALNR